MHDRPRGAASAGIDCRCRAVYPLRNRCRLGRFKEMHRAMRFGQEAAPRAGRRSPVLAGIGLMLLGVLLFSVGDALGKLIVATYSVGQLLLLRACASLVVLSPLIWRQRSAFRRIERP